MTNEERKAKNNAYAREYYQRPGVKEKHKASAKKWKQENPERKRDLDSKWRADNREKARLSWHRYKERHPERHAQLNRESYLRTKEARNSRIVAKHAALKGRVFQAYGIICSCCGISDIRFLSIDHVNNDGHLDRKQGIAGARLYTKIEKAGYPKDYQVLCMNCNFAKRKTGVCPHQEDLAIMKVGNS